MTAHNARILVIDDEKPVCLSCKRILQEDGHQVEHTTSGVEGVARAVDGDFDLVLLDLKMPDLPGMEALDRIKRERPDVTVIIITGYATIQTSIEAIKKGAFNYVPKPFTPEELSISVAKALEDRRVRNENAFLKQEVSRLQKGTSILGRSKAMDEVRRQILKIAPTSFTVTIYGESGTGKEVVAKAIHENSSRSAAPFVAVDISSLTPTLVESELFGHVKGAFTGATQTRPGYFSIASGGTLFLDEISNMTMEIQGKLLRVIESRRVRPVGRELEQEVDVRILAATNRDLAAMVERGLFREDLYYRLSVIPLTLPPLRERTEDIPVLAMHFLKKAAGESGGRVRGFATEAVAKLMAYKWPGNVRELRNVTERLVATVDDELIRVEHLPPELSGDLHLPSRQDPASIPQTMEELKEHKRRVKDIVSERLEKQFVLSALERANWNVTRAAQLVEMQRTNFHGLMRRYGIRSREHGAGQDE
jgi:two-component system NtrC family response regulator